MRHEAYGVCAALFVYLLATAGCGDASRAAAPPPLPVVKVEPVVQRDRFCERAPIGA